MEALLLNQSYITTAIDLLSRTLKSNNIATETIVYHSSNCQIPMVIDTGTSVSLTPCKSEFVTDIVSSNLKLFSGLQGETAVHGHGIVGWNVRYMFRTVRTIKTEAHYVPEASV